MLRITQKGREGEGRRRRGLGAGAELSQAGPKPVLLRVGGGTFNMTLE